MIPIVCIVGASNSGKTTFLEKLIPELRGRGYRVGTVKHDVHGFEMDREGKDTWRHREAGANSVTISSPARVANIRAVESEMSLEELVGHYFWREDILLTEGYKRSRFPKIEIFRTAVEPQPICGPQDNVIALVTDEEGPAAELPTFKFEEVSRVADLIADRFLKGRKQHRIQVLVDGKRLPMNEFVQDFLIGGIRGMLSTLRGWQKAHKIDIQMRLKDE